MKISVIVPIYNVEQYLTDCLKSIVGQTLKDIEIILVNDGSTDGSLQIAESFASKDERIRLISQKNAGQAAARNAGLEMAMGEYVIFVDSDDWIEQNMIEVLYEHIVREQSDFAQCRFQFDHPVTGKQTIYGCPFQKTFLIGAAILKDALLVENIMVAPVVKIYNRHFLLANQLKFMEGIVNEDTLFAIQIACCAKRVSFVNQILYHAIEREGSTSRSSYERLCSHMIIALEEAKKYMLKKNIFHFVENFYQARYLKSILYNILQMAQRLPYKEYRQMWSWNMMNSFYPQYNSTRIRRFLPVKHRIMLQLSKNALLCFYVVRISNLLSFRMH